MKRLTTIKKEVEDSVKSWIDSQDYDYGSYDYSVRIEDNTVQVCFDGGTIWDFINEHLTSVEDEYWDNYFCNETASKIFGLDKYNNWQVHASWRLDIYND